MCIFGSEKTIYVNSELDPAPNVNMRQKNVFSLTSSPSPRLFVSFVSNDGCYC